MYELGVPVWHANGSLAFFANPGDVLFLYCDICDMDTPTSLENKGVYYVVVCGACGDSMKFRRFVLHEKCMLFVECYGFVALECGMPKTLMTRRKSGEARVPNPMLSIVWNPEPFNHICGQAIDISKDKEEKE